MKTCYEIEETRYIRSLRKEIVRLKSKVSQLRKKNKRLEHEIYNCEEGEEPEVEPHEEVIQDKKYRFTCPSCGSYHVQEFTAGNHEFYSCSVCSSKGRKNSKVS